MLTKNLFRFCLPILLFTLSACSSLPTPYNDDNCCIRGISDFFNAICEQWHPKTDCCDPKQAEKTESTCYDLAETDMDVLFCDACAGKPKAIIELADRYHAGDCFPRDLSEALRWYKKAAKRGSTYAALMLSILYEEGRGVKQNYDKSVYWYEYAAKRHDLPMAEFRIAKRFLKGYGLPQSDERAYYWFHLAANRGFAPAQIEIADALLKGRGVVQDEGKAFDWYLLAAEQNHSYAQSMVGILLLEGRGIDQNIPEAIVWTQKAAYQGARQAQYQLGQLYLNGIGVKPSRVHAYAWWMVSLKGLQDKLPDDLVRLFTNMDPVMRKRAVTLATEYQQKYNGHTRALPKI